MSGGQPPNLEAEILELRKRVRRLEEALEGSGITLPSEASPQPVPQVHAPATANATFQKGPPSTPILPTRAPAAGAGPQRSLESRIGSQWFNRIGILAVLVGASWFLKLAVDNHWVSPPLRVLIGLVAGAGLIAWSERFRAGGYSAFSYSLKSIGSGLLYLSLWAAFSLFQLIPASLAFAAMIIVTALNGFLAWRQEAELLAFYALTGGFAIPMLVASGGNHEIALFSYILLLDLSVVGLLLQRPWSRLLFASFAGTVIYAVDWYISWYSPDQWGATFLFFALFLVLFAVSPALAGIDPRRLFLIRRDSPRPARWDRIATALLPVLNAGLGFLGLYLVIRPRHSAWAEPGLAVACAVGYLLLALSGLRPDKTGPRALADIHLATAVAFVTLAIPLATSGHAMIVGWFAEGAGLTWAASRTRMLLPRALGLFSAAVALIALLGMKPAAHAAPILNGRFATYLCAIAAFAFIAWIAHRAADAQQPAFLLRWRLIGLAAVLALNALILITIVLEIHTYWSQNGPLSPLAAEESRIYAQFSYSAVCMAFGAILLGIGFWRDSAFLRWQALVLLALSIAKVFLVDMSQLSQGYRILSFLGLGALLLGVSFLYQRDSLGLRRAPDRRS